MTKGRWFWRWWFRSYSGNFGVGLVLALMVTLGLVLAVRPFDGTSMNLALAWEAPGLSHLCGLDGLGRDVLSRLIAGTGMSLAITLLSLSLALVVGMALGVVAAWSRGRVDVVIMRVADLMRGLPEVSLAILAAAMLGPGVMAVILTLAAALWPGITRLVRSQVMTQRHEFYVAAAGALGASPVRILFVHVVPNIIAPILVRCASGVGPLIMAEATLSFLGIGVQEPSVSLGTLIRDGLSGLRPGPHEAIAATLTVFLVALAFTLLADGLRDALEQRCGR